MILYDDKHNFLGMSSHTLGFLGYEDINEFLSLNNDFANLFVNKEGYIYKFDNFAWIDFVLYSGSANKSAIITLKNGQETQVDISIKEVFLTHPIGDIKKLYSIKLLSNNFQEISGITKTESTTNGFSLGGLIKSEPSIDEKDKIEAKKVEFKNLLQEDKQQEQKIEQEITPIKKDEFKINLFEEQQSQQDPTLDELNSDKLDKQNELDKQVDQNVNFLKKDKIEDKKHTKQIMGFTLLKDEEDTTPKEQYQETKTAPIKEKEDGFLFDFLKAENQPPQEISKNEIKPAKEQKQPESEEKPEIKLDFLAIESSDNEIKEQEGEKENLENPKNEFKLDFLNIGQKNKNEEINTTDVDVNKSKIIQQIKDDIKEIDSVNQKLDINIEATPETMPKEELLKLEIPNTPQVEQPLNLQPTPEVKKDIENEKVSYDEGLPNFQIQESKELSTKNSFTNTLKNLFDKKTPTLDTNESNLDSGAYEFKLKSNNDEISITTEQQTKDEKVSTEHTIEKIEKEVVTESKDNESDFVLNFDLENKKSSQDNNGDLESDMIDIPTKPSQNTQEITFPSLSALGLSADEEFDLVCDFIADTKEGVSSIEQFIETKDFDNINYSLVKIKSSAEILNLDAIIDISNSIRKHCITKDVAEVKNDKDRLSKQIKLLEQHLEETAV